MKIFPILFLLGLSLTSGCASEPVQLPDWNIVPAQETAQYPLGQPERPVAASSTGTTITFDEAGIRALEAQHEAAVANHAIATANAQALEAQSRAYNSLIEAGQYQQQIAEIRQELLDIERRNHFVDNWFYRGLIALGLIAAVL